MLGCLPQLNEGAEVVAIDIVAIGKNFGCTKAGPFS